ncbi:uncharacterized protein LOC126372048 isoform X1 [Pectinophora gossypiella]|uniref:uncharacterized protein LOC126372048 isoform X1 n=1 Tax=Pectinophora gossypiella TaxID=13191 RepID=UPI00214DF71C|nr:uncharacterized protein LOC126372048 isoform X1 [Pectinophora gossypiella]
MDRFIVKEPRVNADYAQGNQTRPPFSLNTGINNILQEGVYFGGYCAEFPIQHGPGFMPVTHVTGPSASYVPNFPGRSQTLHDIDARYLGTSENNATCIAAGQRQQQLKQTQSPYSSNIGFPYLNDYENRNFIGADRNSSKTFTSQVHSTSRAPLPPLHREEHLKPQTPSPKPQTFTPGGIQCNQNQKQPIITAPISTSLPAAKAPFKDNDSQKNDTQFPVKTRAEKIRDLHKSGARAFSGPVEKVLKWHKSLQDFGLLVLYEIVAKCVSIRPGETCAKHLVIRDDSGPAIQVVYYEIDFLLPELQPPCTIRVIGRMMAGTCRLQAFNVRQATGDDVATLPRRAAVAAHHVAKLCKEYGVPV